MKSNNSDIGRKIPVECAHIDYFTCGMIPTTFEVNRQNNTLKKPQT